MSDRSLSYYFACILEFQPWAAREQAAGIAITEVADEVRLDPPTRKKIPVNQGVVEAGHGTAIESEGAGGQHEIGGLQGAIAEGCGGGDRFLAGSGEPGACIGVREQLGQ